jgi:AcrR family transcriptional regulator
MRGRPPHIREQDILDSARDVFREDGHATTTAKIARRAGVSEGIIYYRYKSKEALLAAVIERETQPPALLLKIADAAAKRELAQNLKSIVAAVLESVSRAHPLFELAETSPTSHVIRQVLFSKAKPPPQRIVELIAEYFEAEMRLGRVRRIDAVPAARAVFGACVDYVRSRRTVRDDGDDRAFVRGLVDLLIHGTAKAPRPSQG